MCGIIGYAGDKNASEILIKGLKRLEYRGYDSAGVALCTKDRPIICKTEGKVEMLEKKLGDSITAFCGIGHTRWATHGAPSDINSHPHRHGRVTLVHNGIIENYRELKGDNKTVSDTDTESAVILIDSLYTNDPIDAIYNAIDKIHGSFAFGILFDDIPDTIYAIRRDSPMIVGYGENENFIASDITAVLPYTKNYSICDENEVAVITKGDVKFIDRNGNEQQKKVLVATWDGNSAEKGGYAHFMLKEIHEQPDVIRATITAHKNGNELFEDLSINPKGRIHIVACGSAWHAGLLGKQVIESLARIPVAVEIASEFRYNDPILTKDDTVIAISQSGETADTLAALRLAKSTGCKTIGIVNVLGSTLSREADAIIHTPAGPEICVATTKAYLCQVTVLYMLALKLARNILGEEKYTEYIEKLTKLPEYISKALSLEEQCKQLSKLFYNKNDVFFIGRGADYSVCTEGSLKLKEVSYIHSEAYAAGELKHGTISLIEEGTPVVSVMTDTVRIPKTVSNIKEVVSRGACVICVTYKDVDVSDFCQHKIEIESPSDLFAPIIANVPLQLYAYYTAINRGCDVDKPRNLAKSVTVE